jgi:anti-sigma factor RsiW
MTCQQVVEFLLDYLSGHLTLSQRLLFEEHLAECPDCAAYLDSYRHTILAARLSASQLVDETLDTMPEELVRAIVNARNR